MNEGPQGRSERPLLRSTGSGALGSGAALRSHGGVGSLSSLARRLLLLITVGCLLLVGVVALSLRLQALARSRVVDQLDPYSISVERLRSSLVDQETGVRGYALSRNPTILEPYLNGQVESTELLQKLRSTFRDEDPRFNKELDAAEASVETWRSDIAVPIIAGTSSEAVDDVIAQSKRDFDQVRSNLDSLNRLLDTERETARVDLVRATRLLWGGLAITMLAVVIGISVVARYLRRHLMDPIVELSERAELVARGEKGVVLDVDGVTEIRRLSDVISNMRRRIEDDLVAVADARDELDRQAEELRRSNRDLEQFAYVASHDLQEPLRKVASFCQLLRDRYASQLDDRANLYIGFAVDGAQRMQALISDLLHFSRVGRTTEKFTSVDLNDLMQSVLFHFGEALESTGGSVEYGELPTVTGDRTLLSALMTNLIGNSIKYRGSEPPRVLVTSDEVPLGWNLRVRDNGIGVAEEYREKVFVIFQRLHGREEYEGTGIGLAMCKKIAEFHGGTISLSESPTGQGTEVTIFLPSEPPQITPNDNQMVSPKEEPARSSKKEFTS